MKGVSSSSHRRVRTVGVAGALCAMVAVAGPAAAQPSHLPAAQDCHIQGSWLGQGDTEPSMPPITFFIRFGGGANATSGPLAVEWIAPGGAVPPPEANCGTHVSPGSGAWQKNAAGAPEGQNPSGSYGYTFVYYALDESDTPVCAFRVSGKEMSEGCDTLKYDYTLEAFPLFPSNSFDPLADYNPMAKVGEGTGTKTRIRLVQPTP